MLTKAKTVIAAMRRYAICPNRNQPTPQFIVVDAELNRWAVANGIKVNTDYGKQGKKTSVNHLECWKNARLLTHFVGA